MVSCVRGVGVALRVVVMLLLLRAMLCCGSCLVLFLVGVAVVYLLGRYEGVNYREPSN